MERTTLSHLVSKPCAWSLSNCTLKKSLKSRRASLVPPILKQSQIMQVSCLPFRNRLSCCPFLLFHVDSPLDNSSLQKILRPLTFGSKQPLVRSYHQRVFRNKCSHIVTHMVAGASSLTPQIPRTRCRAAWASHLRSTETMQSMKTFASAPEST